MFVKKEKEYSFIIINLKETKDIRKWRDYLYYFLLIIGRDYVFDQPLYFVLTNTYLYRMLCMLYFVLHNLLTILALTCYRVLWIVDERARLLYNYDKKMCKTKET